MARHFSPSSLIVTAASVTLAAGWTMATGFGWFDELDHATVASGLTPDSATAQIAAAYALALHPWILWLVLAGVAVWALQRRLRNLGIGLLLAIAVGQGLSWALKFALGRQRPHSELNVITNAGYAYPSGHMIAATVTAAMLTATVVVTRQSRTRQRWAGAIGGVLIIATAIDRWIMNAHWLSDIIGGVLLGAAATCAALIGAGVRILPDDPIAALEEAARLRTRPEPEPGVAKKRCAIIYNPTKVLDRATFQRHIEFELDERGWDRPIWLETTADDPGRQMAQVAIRKKVDLVLGAGGDGTIRVICGELAGTGIRFGIIPAGTGNLLARNLGVPLDEPSALRVAFDGVAKPIDLVQITTDDSDRPEACAVMAGIGIDAAIMENTDADLKKVVGSAAYFVAAAQHADHPPLPVSISVDGGAPFKRRASVLLIGNVGLLQGGIHMIPGAMADDGELDLLVASPRTLRDWARLTSRVLTRRAKASEEGLDLIRAKKVEIVAERRDAFQLDGDTEGHCTRMTAEIQPAALQLMLPQ